MRVYIDLVGEKIRWYFHHCGLVHFFNGHSFIGLEHTSMFPNGFYCRLLLDYGEGYLLTGLQKLLDRFEVENITLSKLTGAPRRIDKRLVDAKALREIIINAFAHNDYTYGMLPICEVFKNVSRNHN